MTTFPPSPYDSDLFTRRYVNPPSDVCRNNHRGDENSTAANSRTNKDRDRARILAHMKTQPDFTTDEIEVALNMSHQTASARMADLKAAGLILPGSWKRKTRSGCLAQPWRIK